MQFILISLCLISIVGCAQKQNVNLDSQFWHQSKQKISVGRTKPTTPRVSARGAQGILDFAINEGMNNKLNQHLEKTDMSWYSNLQGSFVQKLQQRRMDAKNSSQLINIDNLPTLHQNGDEYADHNYTGFTRQISADKLLLIKISGVGVVRHYYGFIPLDEPKAYCTLSGELIDVNNNHVLWRHKTEVALPIDGKWDEAPNFPNISRAVKNATITAQQDMLDSFFNNVSEQKHTT